MSESISSSLIRRYCDGELPAAEASALERHLAEHPADRARVAFERALRARVGQILCEQTPAAPQSVLVRLRAALQQENVENESGPPQSLPFVDDPAQEDEAPAASGWLAGPRRANIFALAASLLLVAGAVVFGIFGPQIGRVPPSPTVQMDVNDVIAPFVADEHAHAAGDMRHRALKLPDVDADLAQQHLTRDLETPILTPDFVELGYQFVGAGHCSIPGREPSGHLLYRQWGREPQPMISVFVVPDHHQFMVRGRSGAEEPLVPGEAYCLEPTRRCQKHVCVFSDGSTVYFVTGCVGERVPETTAMLQQTLLAPAR